MLRSALLPIFVAALLQSCSDSSASAEPPEEVQASANESAESATENPGSTDIEAASSDSGLFALSTHTLAGEPQELSDFQGKVLLVVNTASKCGLTPQYKGLQELHEKYAEQGLVVVGFPCNQFQGQEPGSAEEIASFCEKNYGVSFPMMEKVNVKNGADQSPIYQALEQSTGNQPDWNFAKYLINRDGSSTQFFAARTDPTGDELTTAIEALL